MFQKNLTFALQNASILLLSYSFKVQYQKTSSYPQQTFFVSSQMAKLWPLERVFPCFFMPCILLVIAANFPTDPTVYRSRRVLSTFNHKDGTTPSYCGIKELGHYTEFRVCNISIAISLLCFHAVLWYTWKRNLADSDTDIIWIGSE